MFAIALHPVEHITHPVRRLTVDVIEDQFRVAEDGIKRRAQLMAHIGQELRFVLASDFELLALLTNFIKQTCILNGEYRLRRKGLEKINSLRSKLAGLFSPHHEGANGAALADQGNDEECPVTLAQQYIPHP